MKKGDLLWSLGLIAVLAFMLVPVTHHIFQVMTTHHPYMMGFIKFGILATMGEVLAVRIAGGTYEKPVALMGKIVVWGLIGMLITLMFSIFNKGVMASQANQLLPFNGNRFFAAFFTSAIMNGVFAPTFMAFHRYTDTYFERRAKGEDTALSSLTQAIDWDHFVSFVVLKTVPFFWIPAHTIVFLLPGEYRVLAAAFLSIALGAILSFSKKGEKSVSE